MNSLGNKTVMAKNIKRYMEKHGLTSQRVCEDLNIPKATFSNWINALTYPRIDKVEMLANYFGCQKADLVEEQLEQKYISSFMDEAKRMWLDENGKLFSNKQNEEIDELDMSYRKKLAHLMQNTDTRNALQAYIDFLHSRKEI